MNNFVYEITNVVYDRFKLLDIFNEVSNKAVLKRLPWTIPKKSEKSVDEIIKSSPGVMIQFDTHYVEDERMHDRSVDFLQFAYIRELMSKLCITVNSGQIDILWYRPGLSFGPHTDGWTQSGIMFPIIHDPATAPIDFYKIENLLEFPNTYDIGEENIVFSHYYSNIYPTLFNAHEIHGVRKITTERVFLRVKFHESFSVMKEHFKCLLQ